MWKTLLMHNFVCRQIVAYRRVSGNSTAHRCVERHKHSLPLSVCQKGTGTMSSDMQHNSDLIMGRNDSQLGCLHLALPCRYYLPLLWRNHKNISPCSGIRVYTDYERIAWWISWKKVELSNYIMYDLEYDTDISVKSMNDIVNLKSQSCILSCISNWLPIVLTAWRNSNCQ